MKHDQTPDQIPFSDAYKSIVAAEKEIVRLDAKKQLLPRKAIFGRRRQDRTTGDIWKTLWYAEREKLTPPVKIPRLDFAGANKRPRNQSWIAVPAYSFAGFIVLIIAAATVTLYFYKQQDNKGPHITILKFELKRVENWQASVNRSEVIAPIVLREPDSAMTILSGRMVLSPTRPEGQEKKKWQIDTTELKGVFDFRSPIQLAIRHPLIIANVTGTRFATNFSPGQGQIYLCEGRLNISYQSSRKSGFKKQLTLFAPARFTFSGERATQAPLVCASSDGPHLYAIFLTDRTAHIGRVTGKTSEGIEFASLDGDRRFYRTEQLLSSHAF